MKKSRIIKISILFIFLFGIFSSILLIIKNKEYKTEAHEYNKKIGQIITLIQSKYPSVSTNEIVDLINTNSIIDNSLVQNFSFDISDESAINSQNKIKNNYNIIYIIYIFLFFLIIYIIYLIKESIRIKNVNKIIKCMEQINKLNYKLDIDDISEDDLSILKNEIYKTTVMLKEQALNSKKEKLQLKDSLSDISHQLKTPLTSILIILDNLIDNPEMEKEIREDFIRDIKREITNITFLVQSILKLSKLDTNTIDFITEEVEISKIINEVKKNLSMLCDLRNVEIILNIDRETKIKCDFKWQVEALSNIVKNSIEHSSNNGKVYIDVRNNKVYLEVLIKDNGHGIDKEDLPHIFDRFYKCKNSTDESIGIGLSLAKKIIEKDNGIINVHSNHNGTVFNIKYFKI